MWGSERNRKKLRKIEKESIEELPVIKKTKIDKSKLLFSNKALAALLIPLTIEQIGRASCRERV
jgi:hypothetical protein